MARAPWRWRLVACTGILLAQATPLLAQPSVLSANGRWQFSAEDGALVVSDTTTGQRVRTLPVRGLGGLGSAQVRELHTLPVRRSVVAVFDTLAELWEISVDPSAEPIYDGFVHDYRMGEGVALPGFLNPRRTKLEAPLRGLAFDSTFAYVLGTGADRTDDRTVLRVYQLDIRRQISERAVQGEPDTAAARPVDRDGREWFEIPLRAGGAPIFIDPRRP